tara:strand:+ start:6527 stop:8161 length:1635 start_codon:yes stop_codon:yes gene_type:complete
MPEETKDLRYDPTKSLQERKESAIAGRLEILQALLWGFSNLSSGQIDEFLADEDARISFRQGLGGRDAAMFNRFFPMFKNIAAGVAEGTTWKDFAALAENLQQIIEIGDGLDSESSNEELFAFLSGGVLSDSLIGDVIEYDGADFEGGFANQYDDYLKGQAPEETSPRTFPDAVGEPIPPVVEPEIGADFQTLPPEGPATQYPTPFVGPGPVDPNESGQAGGGGAIETVPPSDGAAPAPGKSGQFTQYFNDLLNNDFFKQAGWEITTGAQGEPLPRGMTLGQYLDDHPETDEAYFNILARQAKNWDTFRVNQAVLFGQTEGEELRTLEDNIKKVRKALSNFGVNLDEVDEATIINIARNAFIMGWDDQEIDQALYDNAELALTDMAKGDHANTVHLLRGKAQDYMLNIDDATLDHYAEQINTGMATLGGITQGFAEMARSEYPALKEVMDKGFLPGTYFGSFQTAATTLLERPVKFFGDDRNMFDVIAKGVPDAETGFRPMTIPEAQTYIRSLPEWEETQNARQSGRRVVENVMKKWGAVGRTN